MLETPEKLHRLLRTFHDVTKLINSELELSKLIDTILSMVIRVMEAQSALMLRLNKDTQKPVNIASRGEWPLDLGLFDDINMDHMAHCLVKQGKPIEIHDLISPRDYERISKQDKKVLNEIHFAPLEVKGKIIGLVGIYSPDCDLNLIELEMFCSLSSQAAIAMENAALYERVKERLTLTREELKHTQAQLIRSEKISSLVEMAMGVAHSIRNPVMSIGGLARLAERDLEADSAAKEKLESVIEDAARLENIVMEFEQFAKGYNLIFESTDIVPLIRKSVEKAKALPSAHGVKITFDRKTEPLKCRIDPVQIMRSLDELILNAIEALGKEGSITITSEQDEDYVTINIADNGKGISSENLTKVFDPFFSTKTQSVGLGLTYVHRIIEDHQGTIELDSEIGKGTTFVIRIPRR